MPSTRLLITGGSTIHGLGYDGVAFGMRAAEMLAVDDVIDLSGVSLTCRAILEHQSSTIEQYGADVSLVMIGGTESLVRPGLRLQSLIERFAPASWHGVAGLEPRARYASARRRRTLQRVQTSLKVSIKTVLFRVLGGGATQLSFGELSDDATSVLLHAAQHAGHVVVVGLPPVDARLFPGTSVSFERTNAVLRAIASTHPKITFLPLDAVLDRWSDFLADHLHLGRSGHEKVAASVTALIRQLDDPAPCHVAAAG